LLNISLQGRMASHLSKALIDIKSYDPAFKVHIRLHEPLWKSNRSLEEISVGILVLSAQLEGLCRECYTKSSGGIASEYQKEYFNKFEPLASVSIGKMEEYLTFMPHPTPSLKDYFKQSGLVTLFPKVASYIINPNRPTFRNQKSTMEGYFSHFSVMNQLMCLSHQLNSDVCNMGNHKYIAHQMALLYQAVIQGGSGISHAKKQIEENFQNIKESLSSQSKDQPLQLPRIQKEWLTLLTMDLLGLVTSLDSALAQPVQPAIRFFGQKNEIAK